MFKELWILENPIETRIGTIKFIKVRNYEKLLLFSSVIQVDKPKAIRLVRENFKHPEIEQIIESLNVIPYIQIIKEVRWLGLYEAYTNLFNFCFEEDGCFDLIESDDELEFYINLIKEMNCIQFEKENSNPELAYYDKLERIAKERRGEIITFKSLVMNVGLFKDNVLDISIYNLHEYFNAIATNKNYDTTVLYQTVSTEKLHITPWYADTSIKKTQLNDNDKQFLSRHLAMVKNNPNKNKNGVVKDIKS